MRCDQCARKKKKCSYTVEGLIPGSPVLTPDVSPSPERLSSAHWLHEIFDLLSLIVCMVAVQWDFAGYGEVRPHIRKFITSYEPVRPERYGEDGRQARAATRRYYAGLSQAVDDIVDLGPDASDSPSSSHATTSGSDEEDEDMEYDGSVRRERPSDMDEDGELSSKGGSGSNENEDQEMDTDRPAD